jgi:F-type H+-transporting ATPase subunit a
MVNVTANALTLLSGVGGLRTVLTEEKTVDFFIHELVPYKFFGQTVYLTTTHVCELIIIAGIVIFALVARYKIMHAAEVPTGFQNVVELLVETLESYVHSTMGKHGKKCYVNYIGTIMILILLCNISGIIGLRAPTADYGTTLCLAIISVAMIQYNNFKYNGFGAIKALFQPIWFLFPINLIGEVATVVSLSLRLFGNIMAGTVMISLYYTLMPVVATIGIPAAFHAYLDVFSGAIQAYVFTMLTMVFITNKIEG